MQSFIILSPIIRAMLNYSHHSRHALPLQSLTLYWVAHFYPSGPTPHSFFNIQIRTGVIFFLFTTAVSVQEIELVQNKRLLNVGMREVQKDINEIKEGDKEGANCFLLSFILPRKCHPSSELHRTLIHPFYSVFQVYLFLYFSLPKMLNIPRVGTVLVRTAQCLAQCLAVYKK